MRTVRGDILMVCGPDPNRLSTATATQFFPLIARIDPPFSVVGSCCWECMHCTVIPRSKSNDLIWKAQVMGVFVLLVVGWRLMEFFN